jgi:hypothetical protein
MKRLLPAIGVLAATLLLPGSASADCSYGPAWPRPQDARGTTFVGTVTGLDKGGDTNAYSWKVERVYAGDLAPGPLARWGYGAPGCHPIVLHRGTRYLISSGYPLGEGGAFSTVAYEMLGDGAVRLASFGREQPRTSAPAVYQVDTFDEALGLLLGMPPTDAAPPAQSSPALPLLLVFGVAAITSGLALRSRPHRGPVRNP